MPSLLSGVVDPEQKRRIIGTQFWKEFFAVAKQLEEDGRPVKYLAQGTIYPDIIESGARKTGGKASTIKSHHNLIPFPEGVHFDLIEPLDHFFKDEVRELGLALGLPEHIVYRQPFPGPRSRHPHHRCRGSREARDLEECRCDCPRGARCVQPTPLRGDGRAQQRA